jgi:far upstream element-binding protein
VPNDCVGLIIGKGGETIRQLQQESGAKIQVARKEVTATNMRNVFVEGTPDRYEIAKKLIDEIVDEHKRLHSNSVTIGDTNPYGEPKARIPIPNNLIGAVIGKFVKS